MRYIGNVIYRTHFEHLFRFRLFFGENSYLCRMKFNDAEADPADHKGLGEFLKIIKAQWLKRNIDRLIQ
jgi:hypothetical protein